MYKDIIYFILFVNKMYKDIIYFILFVNIAGSLKVKGKGL
jgi:hypothetical protein